MKVHVLGSGSCMVEQKDRSSSGYLLETGEGLIMVDTGTGTTKNIPDTGFSVEDIDAVVSTHRHPDHISDLVPVIQDKIVRSMSAGEGQDVELYGPEGHISYVKDRVRYEIPAELFQFPAQFGFDVSVIELDKTVEIEGAEVEAIEADHGPEGFKCLSLSFEADDEKVVFTGDTDYNPELEDFAENADVLVTDCSKPDDQKSEGHMTPTECARIAESAGVERLVLSHLYPEAEAADLVSTASETFGGEIVVAEDLMEIGV